MNAKKWAKGPWRFNGSMSIRDAYNRPIATVRSCDPKMDGSHNENRDTALLMAAAPELFDALAALVEHDECLIEQGVLRHFIEMERAALALKKARGEE